MCFIKHEGLFHSLLPRKSIFKNHTMIFVHYVGAHLRVRPQTAPFDPKKVCPCKISNKCSKIDFREIKAQNIDNRRIR